MVVTQVTLGILQVLGIFVVIPAVVGLALAGAFTLGSSRGELAAKWARRLSPTGAMTCSIDADCPPGYVCHNGICVPQS